MVLTFQLLLDCETVIFCFLCCFLSFILSLVSFYRIFRRIFRFSSQSHSPLPPPPPPPRLLQTIRSTIPRSWLTQKVRAVMSSELQTTG